MEFLIPPKQQDEPMEIRRQIQEALSPNNKPQTAAFLNDIPSRDKSKSPSLPYNSANPKYHENVCFNIIIYIFLILYINKTR